MASGARPHASARFSGNRRYRNSGSRRGSPPGFGGVWRCAGEAGIHHAGAGRRAADLRFHRDRRSPNAGAGSHTGSGPYSRAEVRGDIVPRSTGAVLRTEALGTIRKRYLLHLWRRGAPELFAASPGNTRVQFAPRAAVPTLVGRPGNAVCHVPARSHSAVCLLHDPYQEALCCNYCGNLTRRRAAGRAATDLT